MRLGDLDALKNSMFSYAVPEMVWDRGDIEHKINEMPTIDAVPVVRCKDCKYSDTFADTTTATTPLKCLNIRYGGVYPDWYCEHGKRRDDE